MKMILKNLTKQALAKRTERFNSPGVVARKKPRLVLTGRHADALGGAQPGSKISLRVQATVTERGTAGQRNQGVLEIDDVKKSMR